LASEPLFRKGWEGGQDGTSQKTCQRQTLPSGRGSLRSFRRKSWRGHQSGWLAFLFRCNECRAFSLPVSTRFCKVCLPYFSFLKL
jgi:hypothetical protein